MTPIPLTRRVAVLTDFGSADRLQVRSVPIPKITRPDEILVRVRATSVNPIEWKMRKGLGLPKSVWQLLLGNPAILGLDFSGTVIDCGADVDEFTEGQDVMGALPLCGSYAEDVLMRPANQHTAVAIKPSAVSHAEAALIPFAGLVAYAGLVTHGSLRGPAPSARVLIVGASGGVGHLAVQMAKHGLEAGYVVKSSSRRNCPFVTSCGADHVVAYDEIAPEEIVGRHPEWSRTFDLMFDAVGDDTYWRKVAPAVLKEGGRYVSAALPQSTLGRPGEDVGLMGALATIGRLAWRRSGGRYAMIAGLIGDLPSKTGFPIIVKWVAEGKVAATCAATLPLEKIADAHRLSETGRTVGKISIVMGET